MSNIVIGIEGLVGAGKTSLCRELIKIIPNTILLNGGNLYRAITYVLIKSGKDIENLKNNMTNVDIKSFMDLFNIEIKIENNETVFYANNEKLDEEVLQSKEVSMAVSLIGGKTDNKNLFLFASKLINSLKENHNVIVAGRGVMKIYNKCDYHFFITASLEERVKRKASQYDTNKLEEIQENIEKRDELQAKAGFYEYSEITTEIDVTNCKSPVESAKKVLQKIKLD